MVIMKIKNTQKFVLFFYIFSVVFLFFGCDNATKKNTKNNKCVHCGMNTEKYQQWIGVIKSKEKIEKTCSPRCLLLVCMRNKEKLNADLSLKDYYEQTKIDAKKTFFVVGSKILGPMGNDFIPFKTKKDAEIFLQDNQRKKILFFDEISVKTIIEYQ